jgi:hypothetical protein
VAQAETVRSQEFVAEIQRRVVTLQARDGNGSTQANHVYVSVTTTAGSVPPQPRLQAAGGFAAAAGCRGGQALTTLLAGVTATAAEYEVLCRGGQ